MIATVRWAASFASCGGRNAEQSSTIVYEIAPGGHLGWHTDATEETQYIIAGTGELRMEDGKFPVGPGSVFVLPTNVRHDLANTGKEPLRAVAFFAAAMFTQDFDNVMLPPKSHILGTPNREGRPRTLSGRSLRASRNLRSFVRDLQHGPARLAVHGVRIVAHQRTGRAAEANLGRLQQHAHEHQEQRHAEDHDDDRDEAPERPL